MRAYQIDLDISPVFGFLGGDLHIWLSPDALAGETSYALPELSALPGFTDLGLGSGARVSYGLSATLSDAPLEVLMGGPAVTAGNIVGYDVKTRVPDVAELDLRYSTVFGTLTLP